MIYLAAICGLTLGVVVTFAGWLIGRLVTTHEREKEAWAKERADLLQRIQAPQAAVIRHFEDARPDASPPAVRPDDDEDFWESQEQLAERLMAEELGDIYVQTPDRPGNQRGG